MVVTAYILPGHDGSQIFAVRCHDVKALQFQDSKRIMRHLVDVDGTAPPVEYSELGNLARPNDDHDWCDQKLLTALRDADSNGGDLFSGGDNKQFNVVRVLRGPFGGLRGVGVGTNKEKRERACSAAIALGAIHFARPDIDVSDLWAWAQNFHIDRSLLGLSAAELWLSSSEVPSCFERRPPSAYQSPRTATPSNMRSTSSPASSSTRPPQSCAPDEHRQDIHGSQTNDELRQGDGVLAFHKGLWIDAQILQVSGFGDMLVALDMSDETVWLPRTYIARRKNRWNRRSASRGAMQRALEDGPEPRRLSAEGPLWSTAPQAEASSTPLWSTPPAVGVLFSGEAGAHVQHPAVPSVPGAYPVQADWKKAEAAQAKPARIATVEIDSLMYSQENCGQWFQDGRPLWQLVEELGAGKHDPLTARFLQLEVVEKRGHLYSNDNRRLWCLKQHKMRTRADVYVRVRITKLPPAAERFVDRFDSSRGNTDIRVRGSSRGHRRRLELEASLREAQRGVPQL
eukprot:TRINITY_DN9107_c0_g1_i2.p1 TRINITY_DN9107_c0_g1~~TRINITY_DN9107_c0_g1_i2.p1  ORF type:complete len:513 (+),score=58.82 TRINITY_DN9107_c0_g1_i2:138-1676(+)